MTDGGVILFFGGSGEPLRDYSIGGFQIALEAVEALRRQLASELGEHGIRTVSIRTGGIIESIPADFEGGEAMAEGLETMTLTGRGAPPRGCRQRRRVRRVRPGAHDDRGHGEHQQRGAHRLTS